MEYDTQMEEIVRHRKFIMLKIQEWYLLYNQNTNRSIKRVTETASTNLNHTPTPYQKKNNAKNKYTFIQKKNPTNQPESQLLFYWLVDE